MHPIVMKEIENDHIVVYWIMILIHTWPCFAVFLNIAISRFVFIPSHAIYFWYFAPFYMVMNYIGKEMRGRPVYPFLDWKDYMTIVIGGVLFAVGMVTYLGMAKVNNW